MYICKYHQIVLSLSTLFSHAARDTYQRFQKVIKYELELTTKVFEILEYRKQYSSLISKPHACIDAMAGRFIAS